MPRKTSPKELSEFLRWYACNAYRLPAGVREAQYRFLETTWHTSHVPSEAPRTLPGILRGWDKNVHELSPRARGRVMRRLVNDRAHMRRPVFGERRVLDEVYEVVRRQNVTALLPLPLVRDLGAVARAQGRSRSDVVRSAIDRAGCGVPRHRDEQARTAPSRQVSVPVSREQREAVRAVEARCGVSMREVVEAACEAYVAEYVVAAALVDAPARLESSVA